MGRSSTLSRAILIPLRFVALMWIAHIFQQYFQIDLVRFGIYPRTLFGLPGIITAPLIHGNEIHILSNTFPFVFLGTTLFLFYPRIALRVFALSYFATGALVWLLARPTFHIGASGVIYSIASFLMFYGLFRKDFKSLSISIVVVLLYGSIFYGVLPNQPGVSFESHLLGALVGLLCAVWLGRKPKPSQA